MSEKEVGKALLQLSALELAGVSDLRQQTWNVLEHDRRRVQTLTALTIALWLLAASWTILIFGAFAFLMPRQAKLMADIEQETNAAILREHMQAYQQMATQKIAVNLAIALGLLALAALTTVFLVLASRRATLRQVNASLLEISEQLKLLRGAADGRAGPT
jgi:hypothetical protein